MPAEETGTLTSMAKRRGVSRPAKRTTTPPPAPEVLDEEEVDESERPVKFTAVLDQHVITMFERITEAMRRPVGRRKGGRYPSRADVLRAMVAVVDSDDDLRGRVAERIRADLEQGR